MVVAVLLVVVAVVVRMVLSVVVSLMEVLLMLVVVTGEAWLGGARGRFLCVFFYLSGNIPLAPKKNHLKF